MTSTTATTAAEYDRTLYGCPSWCTNDHRASELDAGDHERRLAGDEPGNSVDIWQSAGDAEPHLVAWLGGNETLRMPVTKETGVALLDLGDVVSRGADALLQLIESGQFADELTR